MCCWMRIGVGRIGCLSLGQHAGEQMTGFFELEIDGLIGFQFFADVID